MSTSDRPLNGNVGPTPTRPSPLVNLAPSNGKVCVAGFKVKPNRNSLIRLGRHLHRHGADFADHRRRHHASIHPAGELKLVGKLKHAPPFFMKFRGPKPHPNRRHTTIVCPATLLPSQCMDPSDRERYSRQILFPGIGERGQEALLESHAVVAGCGALGSFHAAALARAGVGRLTLIDRDYVELSNLHRQWLFEEADAAEALPKAAAAERRIARINSSIRARGVIADLTSANVAELLGDADIILDRSEERRVGKEGR